MEKKYAAYLRLTDGFEYELTDVVEVEHSSSTTLVTKSADIVSHKVKLGYVHSVKCESGLFFIPNPKDLQFLYIYESV